MTNDPSNSAWTSRWSTVLALVGAVTVARLAYLAWLCPYALIEDEAHYWEWSRHLDWSYYSKGPGIAWAIAASTRLLGVSEFGVRAPAALFAAVAAIAVAGLARDATGERRAGFYAAACILLAPMYQVNALLMTIDMPYLAAWAMACWGAWRLIGADARGEAEKGAASPRSAPGTAWIAMGVALAAGFVFKYTILLLIPGLVVFMVLDRLRRGSPMPWGAMLAGLAIAALGLVPVAIWNSGNGWPTVHHLLGHLGWASGDIPAKDRVPGGWRYEPRWTLEFIGIQLVILGPVLYLGLVGLARGLRSRDAAMRRAMTFLLCCGSPIVAFYLLVTLFTEVEGNWASAGYVTLLPAAGWAAASARDAGKRTASGLLWRWSLIIGVVVGALSLRLDWVAGSAPMAWLDRALQAMNVKDDRPLIPAGRLMAAPAIAADARRLAEDLGGRTGLEPFYVAEHYGRASLLAFYIPGHPTVYCSSSLMDEGRKTQYDFWPDTDLTNMAVLGGRPAVCLGKTRERWEEAFGRVEDRGKLEHEPKKDRLAFLGFDYRGFGYRDVTRKGATEGK